MRLNKPETLPRSEMLHFKPKDLSWACLFWLVTINLSCLSVQSYYKTKCQSLRYSILWSNRSPRCTFGGFSNFPAPWFLQDFKLLPLRSRTTRWFWKCWTQRIMMSPAWWPKAWLLPALQSCCSLAFFRWLRTLKTQPQYQVIWPFSSISKENVFLGFWSMRVKQFWKWQSWTTYASQFQNLT